MSGHTPVFPIRDMNDHPGPIGLTLRDYFAAKAFVAIVSMPENSNPQWIDDARQAYKAADALLKAREQ